MDLLPFLINLIEEEDHNRNHLRLQRKHLRDRENPFTIPDEAFRQYFRLSKGLVIQEIINPLQNHYNVPGRADAIPLHLKILATISFLANGSDQKAIGNSIWTCMSQPTFSKCLKEIKRLIVNHLTPIWIIFPTSRRDRNIIQQGFFEKWGMRGIIGAIDGTHIEIVAPSQMDEEHQPHLYINRKGRHSINVMLICDSNACITALNARFPESVHDAAIWQTSNIRRNLRNDFNVDQTKLYLIADSGYPVEPWLLTPINNVVDNTPEARYNAALRSSRNVVERTNGLLKGIFRCLSKFRMLQYHPTVAAYIIYSAGTLYNMIRKNNLVDDNLIEDVVDEAEYQFEENNLLERDNRIGQAERQ